MSIYRRKILSENTLLNKCEHSLGIYKSIVCMPSLPFSLLKKFNNYIATKSKLFGGPSGC